MTTEQRTFRPFDVPRALEVFLADARLTIGSDPEEYVESGSRRRVDVAELRSGDFSLEIARDDESFQGLVTAAHAACSVMGEGVIEFAVIASGAYLKRADVLIRRPMAEVERVMSLIGHATSRTMRAAHHGCDIDAYLVLDRTLDEAILKPWRKATWLGRARFQLRTSLEGLGWTILPLTDELRTTFGLSPKTLRYTEIGDSPLEATSTLGIKLYVHDELLARLRKSPRKVWAKSFMDQLAVDALAAIALKALADPEIHNREWGAIQDSLLGSLIAMVDGMPGPHADDDRQRLLEMLRLEPLKFAALIEGALAMRDSVQLIIGDG